MELSDHGWGTSFSKSTVNRVWNIFSVKPHLQKNFKLSNDPFFVEKVVDIVGLYRVVHSRPDPGQGCAGAGTPWNPRLFFSKRTAFSVSLPSMSTIRPVPQSLTMWNGGSESLPKRPSMSASEEKEHFTGPPHPVPLPQGGFSYNFVILRLKLRDTTLELRGQRSQG